MEIGLSIGFAIALGLLAWAGWRLAQASTRLGVAGARSEELERRLTDLTTERTELAARLLEFQNRLEGYSEAKASAETRHSELLEKLAEARIELDEAKAEVKAAREAAESAKVEREGLATKLSEQEKRLSDFEETAKRLTEAAKAATLESSKLLAGQLLETHKREAEEQRKQQEQVNQQNTEKLFHRFNEVAGTVAALQAQLAESRSVIDTVHRALSHTGGVGQLAEEMLENLLKSFGLEPGRDYIMQYHAAADADRGALRPDAVVFLPGDAALVIDSKATKSLLEHAQAASDDEAAARLSEMAKSVQLQLNGLAKRDYKGALSATYGKLERGGALRRIMKVMALPTDSALEKLREADPNIERRALAEDIILAGPSALTALIASARLNIDLGRQSENHEKIVAGTTSLLEGIATALEHLGSLNRGILTAAKAAKKFVGSINRSVLPPARRLVADGIRPNKQLPGRQATFDIVEHADDVIEAEAEDVTPRLPGIADK